MSKGFSAAPRLAAVSLVAVAALFVSIVPARGQVPQGSPTDLPVLSDQTPRGEGTIETVEGPAPVAKVIDGDISDWVGEPSRYGGTALYSAGELVYQDHLFDAHGPDDGRDAKRLATTAPLEVIPGSYRIESLAQADLSGELGVPIPEDYAYDDSYGDATAHQDTADLVEVRAALGTDSVAFLARTTTMNADSDTALLVLADTVSGSEARTVPFGSGITTSAGDIAFFVMNGKVQTADLSSGEISSVDTQSIASAEGWKNAIEFALPRAAIEGSNGTISLAIASGKPNAAGDGFEHLALETADSEAHANLANVAFRLDEPVRMWFEQDQALALHAGTIDDFFYDLDLSMMADGSSQEYDPGHGYHDRIFLSDDSTKVPQENGRNGVFQHYGVYLPAAYTGEPLPLQWWLHWRGGTAHSGAAVVPKVFKQFGEDVDSIVVAPSGRGTSTWYVGKGHVDILEVWADVFDTFAIDRRQVYVTGHSMGGWGSYLLALLYPDRFAGAAPVAGPVTQGAWTGLEVEGCDEYQFEEYTPCWVSANDGRPRDQHNRKLLDNARHVPFAILQGTSDELVWYWAVSTNAARLTELGYRHRFYTYPGYEHYSHPIADQWSEAAAYLHQFVAPEKPAHVTYKRDMLFELATEQVQAGEAELNFDFDSAYWMSGLTPVDLKKGTASFDGRSLAIADPAHLLVPDTGAPTAPGQTGPYFITGLQWIDDPTASAPSLSNGFDVTLAGAAAVQLDLDRMDIDVDEAISGTVTTEHDLTLKLAGGWETMPEVTIGGVPASVTLEDGVLTIVLPSGDTSLEIS